MNQQDAQKLFLKGIQAFGRAEQAGMRIDVEYCQRKMKHLERQINHIENRFRKSKFGYYWQKVYGNKTNYNSDHQLGHLLYDKDERNLKAPKETKGGTKGEYKKGSVDEESLNQLVDQVPELSYLIKMKKLSTLKNTYLEQFMREQVDGWIHPFLNLHLTKTFRPSTDSPNMANIPKRDEESKKIVRKAVYPRKGHQFLEIDFSGIEVMIAACYHKDKNMLRYLSDKNSDMHSDVCHQAFILKPYDKLIKEKGFKNIPEFKYLRDATKNSIVFPQFYGDYYKNNAINVCKWVKLPVNSRWPSGLGILMPDGKHISDHFRSKAIRSFNAYVEYMQKVEDDFWNNRFPEYRDWKESWYKKYQRKGYFDTLTGFRCSGVMRKNEVINYPIQGSAFHCLLWTFIETDKIMRKEKWNSRLVNQVYDAVLVDAHPDELNHVAETIKEIATKKLKKAWPWIIVDLEVDADVCPVDGSWAEKQRLKGF